MPRPKSFQDLFLDQARDLYDAEEQLTQAFPKLAEAAASDELRAAIETHFEETRTHIQRLEEVFELLDEQPSGQHCAGMADILQETSDLIEEEEIGQVRDAGIVANAQRAVHYEIDAYDSLIASAATLGAEDVAAILRRTLDEEKAADEMLQSLAERRIDEDRAGARRGMADHTIETRARA
jgi:ferritin-like metal-binding protein YciE